MHRLFILFVCCLVIFTDMVGYSIITPSIPLFAKLFKASNAAMGYAFAAYPVAFLITIIPFGVALGMLLSASMLLIALHSKPGEQGSAYGIWNFSFSVGYLWGPSLGGTLSDFFHANVPSIGFQVPFFLFSILILLCLFIFKIIILREVL